MESGKTTANPNMAAPSGKGMAGVITSAVQRSLPQGSLRRSLASGAFWSLVGAVASRGCVLVAGIFIARFLGKAGFGEWGLVLTTVSMFAQFASLGTAMTATKYVAELKSTDPARGGRTLSLILLVGLGSTAFVGILLLLLSEPLAANLFRAPHLHGALALASIMLFGMVGMRILQGTLAGFEDFRRIARMNVVHGVTLLLLAVPFTWTWGLRGAVAATGAATILAMAWGGLNVIRSCSRHRMPLALRGVWDERRVLWHYSLPSLLTGAITGPAMTFSQAIVAHTPAGLAGLGGFQAAAKWREIILFAPGTIRQVTLPMLSRLKSAEAGAGRYTRALWANIGLNVSIALLGAVPVMLLAKSLLRLYGPGFAEDWDIMVILALSAVFQAANDVVTQVTASMEKMWWNFAIHIVWSTCILGGTYALTPANGVRGFVWALFAATVIHMILNSVAAFVCLRQRSQMKACGHP